MLGTTALLLALLGGEPSLAALPQSTVSPSDTTTVPVDSARVDVRPPPDSLVARFQRDPAFEYRRAQRGTWWHDLRRWFWTQVQALLGENEQVARWLRIGFYLVLAIVVGYAAYVLVQLRSTARTPIQSSPSPVAAPQTSDEMHAIDFQKRVAAARAENDYRRAVRLLYLQTLQRLDRAGALTWRPSTTNRAYVEQLDGTARSAFATLTRLFERIWYGTADVDAERFEHVQARFETFWAQANLRPSDDSTPTARALSSDSDPS